MKRREKEADRRREGEGDIEQTSIAAVECIAMTPITWISTFSWYMFHSCKILSSEIRI
jgi:hypothetical protein